MPAALPADWTTLRLLAGQGVTLRELSETSGIDLDTLKARSAREGWKRAPQAIAEQRRADSVAVAVKAGKMQPLATNGAELASDLLSNRGKLTKLGLSMFTTRAARVASRLPKQELLARSTEVKAVSDIAAKLWPAGSMTLRLSANQLSPVIDIEAEVIEQPEQ